MQCFSKLCKKEKGLKEELAKAETAVIYELRALTESVHHLWYHQSLMQWNINFALLNIKQEPLYL